MFAVLVLVKQSIKKEYHNQRMLPKQITKCLIFIIAMLSFSCGAKGKYSGTITITWNDQKSRLNDVQVIKMRLKKLDITNYNVKVKSDSEIEIDIKHINDTSKVINMLVMNEVLGFWECFENDEVFNKLDDLNRRLGKNLSFNDTLLPSLNQYDMGYQNQQNLINPLWSRLQYSSFVDENQDAYLAPGPVVGFANPKDTASIDSLLKIGYKLCLPHELELKWYFFNKEDISLFSLVALKRDMATDGPFMNQSSIKKSTIEDNMMGNKSITIKFDEKATSLWERITRKNIGRSIAITMGNKVICYPKVESTITGGVATITGPDPEELKTIHMAIQMPPYKTKPVSVKHHFELNK